LSFATPDLERFSLHTDSRRRFERHHLSAGPEPDPAATVPLDDRVVAAEQRLADPFATADQIPEAPDFVKWVDRRFNSVLPVSNTT
jgi:hypothetical protein